MRSEADTDPSAVSLATVDLRSDYFRRPTPAMIEAMVAAARETAGFAPREDPYVRELESLAAALLGKEDSLFVPTCSMANQIAIQLSCGRGDGFVAEAFSHVIVSEAGAPAALSGAVALPVAASNGQLPLAPVRALLDEQVTDSNPRPRLLVLENTHTRHGGIPLTVEATAALGALAHRYGLSVHLDGARLFNACLALECAPAQLAAHADTVSLSLNKGLGAPLGAILAGSKGLVREAMRVRQRFGGNWRTAGIPAAAAIVALRAGFEHLAVDHVNAVRLASALQSCSLVETDPTLVRTNIVLLQTTPGSPEAPELVAMLAAKGVLALARGRRTVRLVLHSGVAIDAVEHAADAFARIQAEQLNHLGRTPDLRTCIS